jgi:hypothetical protein
MEIKFTANEKGKPPLCGPIASVTKKKIADCELRFDEGPLSGLKLQGFTIWERTVEHGSHAVGDLSVSPPSFQYKESGQVYSCSLLRPVEDFSYADILVRGDLKEQILAAYRKWAKSQRSKARRILDRVAMR